jgi:hypothetical protein
MLLVMVRKKNSFNGIEFGILGLDEDSHSDKK